MSSSRNQLLIMDAGCGTGLVGDVLHKSGFRNMDSTDTSEKMVEKVREVGVYRCVEGNVDINEPPRPEWLGAYYEETDYQRVSEELVASNRVELVKELRDAPSTKDSDAHYSTYIGPRLINHDRPHPAVLRRQP